MSEPKRSERARRSASPLASRRARWTFGVLLAVGQDVFELPIMMGMLSRARELDIDLIMDIRAWEDNPTPKDHIASWREFTRIFVSPDVIDGLIIPPFSVFGSTQATELVVPDDQGRAENISAYSIQSVEVQRYLPTLIDLPIISLGSRIEGKSGIIFAEYQGYRDMVRHMIEAHGYRRLLLLRAEDGSAEAINRYTAYVDTLKEYDIPYDPALVLSGNWGPHSARQILGDFLSRDHPPFDAVLGLGDGMALGALWELQTRGFRVPEDVAVAGFEDNEEAFCSYPGLTTCHLPKFDAGRRAIDLMLAAVQGESTNETIALSTPLVIRRSCGCPRQMTFTTLEDGETVTHKQNVEWVTTMLRSIGIDHAAARTWTATLFDSLHASITEGELTTFLRSWYDMVEATLWRGSDTETWQRILGVLSREAFERAGGDQPLIALSHALTLEASSVLTDLVTKMARNRLEVMGSRDDHIRDIHNDLATTANEMEVVERLATRLSGIGIATWMIALYEHYGAPADTMLFMGGAVDHHRINLSGVNRRIRPHDLYPDGVMDPERRRRLIVFPLMQPGITKVYTQAVHFGMLVFELTADEESRCDIQEWYSLIQQETERSIPRRMGLLANIKSEVEATLTRLAMLHQQHQQADELEQQNEELAQQAEELEHQAVVLERQKDELHRQAQELTRNNTLLETEIAQRKLAEEKLARMAFYDQLTGLPNRTLFFDRLSQAVEHAQRRDDYVFAILYIDLDRFKIFNDTLGHDYGDALLRAVAERMQSCVRPGDTVARLGGDEFTILLDDVRSIADPARVAGRVQEVLGQPVVVDGRQMITSASIGIALSTSSYDTAGDLLRNADAAMYRAKLQGKARHVMFDAEMHEQVSAILRSEAELWLAIERHEFRIYYQPIFRLSDHQVIGFESLVRWEHPEQGLIPSASFIGLAEETGAILPIGRWVLRESCRQMAAWQRAFGTTLPLYISVNISGREFAQPDIVEQIITLATEAELPLDALMLELGESVMSERLFLSQQKCADLRARHCRVCIDRFGAGNASLAMLPQLAVDAVKLDRALIWRLTDSKASTLEVTRAITNLAMNLELSVHATGIETEAQLRQLQALNVDQLQGHFFAEPLDVDDATRLLSGQFETV